MSFIPQGDVGVSRVLLFIKEVGEGVEACFCVEGVESWQIPSIGEVWILDKVIAGFFPFEDCSFEVAIVR
jgi:hypothetical protein